MFMKILKEEILIQQIDAIAQYDLENENVFGSSYFVYQNGRMVFKKHYGETGDGNPVTDATLFRLASMTKPITAAAMLLLEDRGYLSLSDPVSRYLPDFAHLHIRSCEDGSDLGETKTEPTILSLLTHASGFGISTNVELSPEQRENISQTVAAFIKLGLKFEPFRGQEYSAYAAFDVLAAIAQKVTGEEYGTFLQRELLEPCGMKDTTFAPSPEQWERVIKMHRRVDGKSAVAPTFPGCVFENFPCSHMLAGAGLVSSLEDYARFAIMLLHKGQTDKGTLLSARAVDKMSKAYVPPEVMPGNQNWGLGVRVVVGEDYKMLPVGSFGWSGAYGSHFWIDPENELCAVYMKNSHVDGGAGNSSACRFEKAVQEALGL